MEKKNKLIIAVAIIGLILIMGGGTYAFFTANTSGNETGSTLTVQGGTLEIEYANQSSVITLNNIYPRSTEWVTKNFTVTGTNTIDTTMNYRIGIEPSTNGFDDGDLTYTLTNTDQVTPTGNPITSASGDILKTETTWIGYGQFAASSRDVVHTYQLKIYYLSTNESQNNKQGATFRAKVVLVEAGIGALPATPEIMYTNYNNNFTYYGNIFSYNVQNYPSSLNAALANAYAPVDEYSDENHETMLVPFFYKHTLLNDIITDATLVVVINNEVKEGLEKYSCRNYYGDDYYDECLSEESGAYNSLTNGTYYITRTPVIEEVWNDYTYDFNCKNEYVDATYGCLDPRYSTNKGILNTIFGISNCSESTDTYYYNDDYTEKWYICSVSGSDAKISIYINSLGTVDPGFAHDYYWCYALHENGYIVDSCN